MAKKKKRSKFFKKKITIPPDFHNRMVPRWQKITGLPTELRTRVSVIANVMAYRISIPSGAVSANELFHSFKGRMIRNPDADLYVEMLRMAIGIQGEPLKKLVRSPFGVIIIAESSRWLSKYDKILRADIDNRIKSTMDCLMEALGVDCDHLVWDIHAEKLPSVEERTTIYLFERDVTKLIEFKRRMQNGEVPRV